MMKASCGTTRWVRSRDRYRTIYTVARVFEPDPLGLVPGLRNQTTHHKYYKESIRLAVIWLLINFIVFRAFRFECVFRKWLPRRAGKRTPEIIKSQKCSDSVDFQMFYPFAYANSMQKTSPMHLNMSPNSFEGSRTGNTQQNENTALKK